MVTKTNSSIIRTKYFKIKHIRLSARYLVKLSMPRSMVIVIIVFGVLVYFIGSGSNDWNPDRMSATEYIGAIAFGALLFYFMTNSKDDVEKTYKPERITIQKPKRKKKKKKKRSARAKS
jgi:hypothetical protein